MPLSDNGLHDNMLISGIVESKETNDAKSQEENNGRNAFKSTKVQDMRGSSLAKHSSSRKTRSVLPKSGLRTEVEPRDDNRTSALDTLEPDKSSTPLSKKKDKATTAASSLLSAICATCFFEDF